jgi:hypothetical protein
MSSETGVVSIRGKSYQTVALRVQKFREAHPSWSLTSEVLFRDADFVVMKSIIADETGRILATGHAEEYRKSSQINSTSALENAETSAHGRSLAALGIGGTEFASANEVENAIHQQAENEPFHNHPKRAALKVAFKALDSMASLQALWSNLSNEDKKIAEDLKDEVKRRVK